MSDKEYTAGLAIHPSKDLEEVVAEISRLLPFLDFGYRDLDEFPAYQASTDSYRVSILGIPCVVENDGSIRNGVTITGEEVTEYSLSFHANCEAMKSDIKELHSMLPPNLPKAALGGYEISSYLQSYVESNTNLTVETDPFPLELVAGNG